MTGNHTNTASVKVVQRCSVISAITNAFLALIKIAFGLLGQSYALLTDGIHSFSDIIIDALVIITARLGAQPPDHNHPYGHRRIETIGTMTIALIILAVGLSLLTEAFLKLFSNTTPAHPATYIFVVAAVSVLTNEILYRYMYHQAKRIQSTLLESSAWHNRSDAITSVIVLISAAGERIGLPHMDSIAAIIISLFIIRLGGRYAWNRLKELVDSGVSEETVVLLNETIQSVPGVLSAHQLRTRLHSDWVLLDAHVQVNPKISVSEGHHIGVLVHQAIKRVLPNLLDSTIHIDVEDDDNEYDTKDTKPTRETLLAHLSEHKEALPEYDKIVSVTLHYTHNTLQIEILLPLIVLQSHSVNDINSRYSACLCKLYGVESVSILFVERSQLNNLKDGHDN